MSAAWIPSPNFHHGRRRPLAFIVWHSTESTERIGAARIVAGGWFAKKTSKVSAHVVVDSGEVVECVRPGDTAWHCANGNAAGYGIEIVGKAGQSGPDWRDAYSLAALRNATAWIRTVPALKGVPARWLTDDQLRRGEQGHTTHLQVARVLGGTTHTDPGPNFPRDYVLQQLGPTTPAPPAVRDLAEGDSGDDVHALQRKLAAWYRLPASWVDGQFGPDTKRYVIRAQTNTPPQPQLEGDGIVGARTRAKLGL